ncbi:hypothetical protein [Actinoplanes missouriensis]|uniref:hypothetical protein n=1 Tax=Actinoplanes missouriensis TaxID=1866 RepID=UPI0036CD45A7
MENFDPADLHAAIERAYIVVWQAGRLRATQAQTVEDYLAHERSGGVYSADNRHPFHRLNADRRFLLIAARDLLRALYKIGEADRIPEDLAGHIEILRNTSEHWDEESGRSKRKFAAAGGENPHSHRWGPAGTTLGELLDVETLVTLTQRIYDELVAIEEGHTRAVSSAEPVPPSTGAGSR